MTNRADQKWLFMGETMSKKSAVPSLLVCFFLGTAAYAESTGIVLAEWEKLDNAGKAALQSGKYADAETQFKAAIEAAKKLPPGDSRLINSLNHLASAYSKQNRLPEAEQIYKQAIDTAEKHLTGEHGPVNLAGCLNNLAALYFKQNKATEAEQLMLRALTVQEKALGTTSKELVSDLENLGYLYKESGKKEQAEAQYKHIVAIWEKNAPDSLQLATALDLLASCYRNFKVPVDSEAPEKRAIQILEKLYGPEDIHLAPPYSNLGNTYKAMEKYDDAEAAYLKSLEITEKVKGSNSIETARCCANLAKLYKAMRRIPPAEKLYLRAVNAGKASGAANVNETIKFMESYADLLRKTGRDDDAEEIDSQIEEMKPKPPAGAKPSEGAAVGEAKPASETKPEEKPAAVK